jgi:endonuclease/exonuclease/phosphatase family metal-dependent hydrolase
MKKLIKLSLLIVIVVSIAGCAEVLAPLWSGDYDVSIMSFNLRFDNYEDGENRWENRKAACRQMLLEVKPSIFGIQEGLYNQVSYFEDNFTDYEYVGVGRDDGYTGGEFSAIFYNKEMFELIDTGNFWLSETPDYPSIGWDANNIRICTWAKLRHLAKDETINVFNTHFDHLGQKSREESAKLIMAKINNITSENEPTFLLGDFNALIGNKMFKPIINSFYEARRFATNTDNFKSYNAFGIWIISRNIDFIFYKNSRALAFKTIKKDYGVPYISDHYPIIAHFMFN